MSAFAELTGRCWALSRFTLLFLLVSSAGAQGCTQCRDNTAATPPATQRAYRHAIALLALTGAVVFGGTLVVFGKHR